MEQPQKTAIPLFSKLAGFEINYQKPHKKVLTLCKVCVNIPLQGAKSPETKGDQDHEEQLRDQHQNHEQGQRFNASVFCGRQHEF